MTDKFRYHDRLIEIATNDVEFLKKKDRSYGASWKESGRSAWFMCRRMIDRLTNMMARPPVPAGYGFNLQNVADAVEVLERTDQRDTIRFSGTNSAMAAMLRHLADCYAAEDLLASLERDAAEMRGDVVTAEPADGKVLAVVRDLRRYLLLAEAEIVQRVQDRDSRNREVPLVYAGEGGSAEGDSRRIGGFGGAGVPMFVRMEDSNRHASLAPWLVDASWREHRSVNYFSIWWEPRGTGRWRLKEFVCANVLPPKEVEHLYAMRTNIDGEAPEYVLEMDHCPPELRPSYRKIEVEVNESELGRLPHWIADMYREVPGAEKWRVTEPNMAWTRWDV